MNSKKTSRVKIVINNITYTKVKNENHVFAPLFTFFLPCFKYMSAEAIQQYIYSIIDMVRELAPQSKRAEKIEQFLSRKKQDRITLLTFITNIILADEKLGLLPGFGMSYGVNAGGRIKALESLHINPERQSIKTKR